MDGKIIITAIILIIAPRDIKVHSAPTISNSEYTPTPNVAAKKHIPLTKIELPEYSKVLYIASFLFKPDFLFSK